MLPDIGCRGISPNIEKKLWVYYLDDNRERLWSQVIAY